MALIKCPECGNEISDKSKACIHCGYPINEVIKEQSKEELGEEIQCPECGGVNPKNTDYCIICGHRLSPYAYMRQSQSRLQNDKPTSTTNGGIKCIYCGSTNVTINYIQTGIDSKSKSVVTRAGNDIGRAIMIVITGGIWALTPKKSGYLERQETQFAIKGRKMCIVSLAEGILHRSRQVLSRKQEFHQNLTLKIRHVLFF